MDIGIERIGFYTPNSYIDIVELAKARGQEPDKFTIGIGQDKQAVPAIYEDAVTMAAESADQILDDSNKKDIGLVIVGTESSVDESKASALFLMDLLDLPENVRAFEIKEACYGATAGLQMAYNFVSTNPGKKALVVASDIARYGINTPGEVTQGAGSVAMLISSTPQILKLENKSAYMSRNVGDFWRPTFSKTAFARGKFSNQIYIEFFETLWKRYQKEFDVTADDFKAMLYHIPYTKMGTKAMRTLEGKISDEKYAQLQAEYKYSIQYGREVGNLYTGSLYLGLLSYLINSAVTPGDELLLFSYGSGAVGELYSAKVCENFKQYIHVKNVQSLLNNRKKISISEYESIFSQSVRDGESVDPSVVTGEFYLSEIKENERLYKTKQ
ncbi:hydroxymethylglutaryl-CoA synthase [Companilactobacillus ginsenosidimutans]|uniref:Hydroxymethylglutaryl-CoA synthase n=1 Tax=Companilactobacillus ginsenosidimutans TaxID=1007676 RepID=A0A0H4QN15_9LACO|nr:hydroxymethylglutaryl-CoA synthase [Companilactobacillus ginsenosidimutans]AKP68128.1 hydroxymethylglutaryl-CoA synthase [Companilactobacillus ginsenosidimutans]